MYFVFRTHIKCNMRILYVEILKRCIDLCFVSDTVLNFVNEQEIGGKYASTVWKVSILNNCITRPTKLE